MSSRFTAAVVQSSPVVFEPKATLAKVRDLTADAARQGARLVVFPEAFVSAYPKGLDFGARVGLRTPKGREDFRRYFDSAIDVPGRATEQLSRTAKDSGVYILTADIDPAEIARGKYDFDVVGHYARPDVFRLQVNEKAMPPVVAD